MSITSLSTRPPLSLRGFAASRETNRIAREAENGAKNNLTPDDVELDTEPEEVEA